MVEGHAVQRLATTHRAVLLHRMFRADSPNGRFSAGAAAIDGRVLVRVEAIGKNLFHFYARRGVAGVRGGGGAPVSGGGVAGIGGGRPTRRRRPSVATTAAATAATAAAADATADAVTVAAVDAAAATDDDLVVVHLHFGMSGQFRTAGGPGGRPPPDARPTTRLRLVEAAPDGAPLPGGLVGLVSASVATAGGPKLFTDALSRLGPDPLRADAVAGRFLDRLAATDRSVGAVLMDQTAIAGVGNIFRSEVCHKARVHPDEPGRGLPPATAAAVWAHAVDLLQRGYLDGAIVTTDGAVAASGRRRYVYNESRCVCGGRVQSWAIATRTAYACLACQPRLGHGGDAAGAPQTPATAAAAAAAATAAATPVGVRDAVVFPSSCAPDSGAALLAAPAKMRIAQLRAALADRGEPTDGKKGVLVARLEAATAKDGADRGCATANAVKIEDEPAATVPEAAPRRRQRGRPPAIAAGVKAAVGEARTLEHVAEVSAATDEATRLGRATVAARAAAALTEAAAAAGSVAASVRQKRRDATVVRTRPAVPGGSEPLAMAPRRLSAGTASDRELREFAVKRDPGRDPPPLPGATAKRRGSGAGREPTRRSSRRRTA
ncbi:hypothetical protein MMPV_001532 [Pyropia vietnamensis]